ncbi:radical SAM protein [Desulfolutivibrio sulfoxidireducens]|uniref:radical SAM protein n=1 Tax=Desulfolutivibrio sulfoxidireducens TaxID=2773299 RepID=UPI00159E832B|nr:radical SAM protein [Desulfolutivibrio sulfoxidireducens]
MGVIFRHPEPTPGNIRIRPVFLPFAGCPGRCVYCAQHLQTGVPPTRLDAALARLRLELEAALAAGRGPYEIGFYGGTFTALPGDYAERFTALAGEYRERGLVTRVRCSTRPDASDPGRLSVLRGLGLDMVEIGAQTFDAGVLAISGRGHGPDDIFRACRAVREAGLALGLQLLPGLPGHTREMFSRDVELAASLAPETARIYPCVVAAGTRLAAMYEAGEYAPWDEETAAEAAAEGVLVLWRAGVRVIRIGLAPQDELTAAVIAGPVHPAMGNLVRARALFTLVRDKARELGAGPKRLVVPARYVGEFWGHGRELSDGYAGLGLPRESVRFADVAVFTMCFEGEGQAADFFSRAEQPVSVS